MRTRLAIEAVRLGHRPARVDVRLAAGSRVNKMEKMRGEEEEGWLYSRPPQHWMGRHAAAGLAASGGARAPGAPGTARARWHGQGGWVRHCAPARMHPVVDVCGNVRSVRLRVAPRKPAELCAPGDGDDADADDKSVSSSDGNDATGEAFV